MTRPIECEEVPQPPRITDVDSETFRDAFQNALDGDFNFEGSFAYGSPLPQAPNPCLAIQGLGILGLPLNERDAQLIIERSAQAPFGHGERTLVDKHVRDTWEIEPTRISFHNAAWDGLLVDLVEMLCKKLGVTSSTSPPKLELYKLLLYESGSHFLPHQDTEKVDGMFATVVLVLPSSYTGGQVHVSHAGSSEVFDFAPHSLTTLSALAWYTDVLHEVKPVTSGYRLVLTYNLIHTAPGIPPPTLPDMHSAVTELRSVLQKWNDRQYLDDPELRIVAYLLKHRYSKVNLKMGALKGEDAHKISHLRTVAQELGYVVGLATLCFHMYGDADDPLGGRRRWNCTSDEDEDDDSSRGGTPGFAEVTETDVTIEDLVDLNGSQIPGLSRLELREEHLIPEEPFEDEAPDESEYEGYVGNGAGGLDYWYRRTVMVLYHQKDEEDIRLFTQGIPYAFKKLEENPVQDKTEKNCQLVEHILRHAHWYTSDSTPALRCVAYCGLRWKDGELWTRAVRKAQADRHLDVFGKEMMLKACKKLPFDEIRIVLEDVVKGCSTFKEKVDFIEHLRAQSSKQKVLQWCSTQISHILADVTAPTDRDVDAVMTVIALKGLSVVVDALYVQVYPGLDSFEFWVALITALHGRRGDLIRPSQPMSVADENPLHPTDNFDAAMAKCFDAALRHCPFGRHHWSTFNANVSSVLRLMDLCLTTANMNTCRQLLSKATASTTNQTDQFQVFVIPFLARLRQLLDKHRIDFCTPPFQEFARTLIEKFIGDVLRGKPSEPNAIMREIGCGCLDCQMLDRFLISDRSTTEFRVRQDRRMHLMAQASTARDLVTFHTVTTGSPHVLVVTKRTEIVKRWLDLLKIARNLLSEIGDERVIAKIMGSRYGDVQKALNGTQAYGVAAKPSVAGTQPRKSALYSGASRTPGVGPVQALVPSTSALASLKRKREGR